jgi:hypothetical protein
MGNKKLGFGTVLACVLGIFISSNVLAADTDTPASSSSTYTTTVNAATLPVLQVATPIPGSPHAPNDFNGDGTSDLVWATQLSKNQWGYWPMTASTPSYGDNGVMRTGAPVFNITSGYYVGAVADFNGDGYADVVFTSDNNDLWLWTNDHQGHFSSTRIDDYPRQWKLVGAGDIDGDGYDDLLWTDPNDCLFAYWTMRGGVRTGYKIVNVTCGYYPMGIGYYTPSNRLSILWTSPINDLYIWDSTPTGFKSYNLSADIDLYHTWAIGGGYMGKGIGVEAWSRDSNQKLVQSGETYDRIFDASGNQVRIDKVASTWSRQDIGLYVPGGYLVQAKGINKTALYVDFVNNYVVATGGGGLAGSDPSKYGNAPDPQAIAPFGYTYPLNWYIVGAGGYWLAAPIPCRYYGDCPSTSG